MFCYVFSHVCAAHCLSFVQIVKLGAFVEKRRSCCFNLAIMRLEVGMDNIGYHFETSKEFS